ncbi:hypothetical protein [Yersinia rohdei]|uniref:hypothetical protein n=1 Tax=Yersinia rohdei TaxID=29485 RepID=UPI00066FF34F|nr:hypothetical protein [Yersinia rohdei]MDN0095249.1 hypothetical protein [Yersinia rohdei]
MFLHLYILPNRLLGNGSILLIIFESGLNETMKKQTVLPIRALPLSLILLSLISGNVFANSKLLITNSPDTHTQINHHKALSYSGADTRNTEQRLAEQITSFATGQKETADILAAANTHPVVFKTKLNPVNKCIDKLATFSNNGNSWLAHLNNILKLTARRLTLGRH